MNKQTNKNDFNAIMRLYNTYLNLINAQDYTGMRDVYNLIKSIALE